MYLEKFIKTEESQYKEIVEKKMKDPYKKDFIFDVDKTIRENREIVKNKNANIHSLNLNIRNKREQKIKGTINKIIVLIEKNEWYLNKNSATNVVDMCLKKLGRNERKLYKWANVKALIFEINKGLDHLRKVFDL